MPFFHFPRFPFPNNYSYFKPNYYNYNKEYKTYHAPANMASKVESTYSNEHKKNNSKNDQDCFFELFGLKLYFDDVLLICLIFFLYQEGVKDDELFVSLILLLLS